MTDPIRLAKRLAALIPCSRREAEHYIEGGWVRVDGEVVEEPQFRVLDQQITLDPEANLKPLLPVTILLHKPTGYDEADAAQLIIPASHIPDDRSGIRMLKRHFAKLTPTAPLATDASGLAVFTQDSGIARKLLGDAAKVEQEYVVEVSGELAPDGLKLLNHGLSLDGRVLPPIKVSWQNETRLRFALKDVRPGQIAQMCRRVGLSVLATKRIRIGRVSMAGLPPGQWRYLLGYERF
ncbi:MAG: rRNA pseudouridine synthase [Burkholderiales bacterium]